MKWFHFRIVITIIIFNINISFCKISENDTVNISNSRLTTKDVRIEDDFGVTQMVQNEDETAGILTSPDYPNPYGADDSFTFNKTFEPGFVIDLYLEDLDLDGDSGDYLLIKSGVDMDAEGTGVILTWHSKKRHYHINASDMFIEFAVFGENLKKHRGFLLSWERNGTEQVTTEGPSTEKPLPTPPNNDTDTELLVSLSGLSPLEFYNITDDFKDMLVNMSTQYCEETDIRLKEPITTSNVILNRIALCPVYWPKTDSCVQVTFEIPVFLAPNETFSLIKQLNFERTTYELTSEHLQEMWDMYSGDMLKTLGLENYHKMKNSTASLIWLSVSLGVCLLFIFFLYYVWKYNYFKSDNRIRRLSESDSIISFDQKGRKSDSSLYPSTHQLVPPLFGGLDRQTTATASKDYHVYESDWMDLFTMPDNAKNFYKSSPPPGLVKDDTTLYSDGIDNKVFIHEPRVVDDFSEDEVLNDVRRRMSTTGRRSQIITIREDTELDSNL